MTRGCFFNANEESHYDWTFNRDPLKLGETRWKIFFSDEFKISMASLKRNKTKKKVEEMLKKSAEGWRQPVSDKARTFELFEQYKVDDGQLYLAWSIDIIAEESKYSQVIRVWDISSASKLPKLAKKLNVLFGRYTLDVLNHCKHKSSEGNLAVRMSWPIDSFSIPLLEANPLERLAGQLAALNLST